MCVFEIFLIAVSLAMDAFAVSVSCGISVPGFGVRQAARVGLWFGLFQFLMPRVPTIYEGDISLSYPVGNTIPHAFVLLVMCSFLTVLMIYPILLILMILFCVYKKKPGRTVLASDKCDA